MPASHWAHLEWTPERLVAWAGSISTSTAQLVEALLVTRPHPEHAYRATLGIIALARRYGNDRVGAACTRALAARAISYTSVKSILAENLDRLPCPKRQPRLRCHPSKGPGRSLWSAREAAMADRPRASSLEIVAFTSTPRPPLGRSELSFEDRLGLLADREADARDLRRLDRRLKVAKLRYPAAVEDIDFRTPRRAQLGHHQLGEPLADQGSPDTRIFFPRSHATLRSSDPLSLKGT